MTPKPSSSPTPDSLFLQNMLGSSNRKNPVIALLEEIDRTKMFARNIQEGVIYRIVSGMSTTR